MKNGAIALVALTLGGSADDGFDDGLASIDDRQVEERLKFLTSDECAGRDTPQKGMLRACDYVAEQFAAAGLEPLGDDGTYLLHYSLPCNDADPQSALRLEVQQEQVECAFRDDFIPVRNSKEGTVDGDVVFAGYGIRDRKYRWDDYKGVNVSGKIVLVLAREPRADSDESKFFDGLDMTPVSSLAEKAKTAEERGAVGMLVVGGSEAEATLFLDVQYPIYESRGRRGPSSLALPSAVISHATASRLLGRSVEDLRDNIDKRRRTDSFAVDGVSARLEVRLTERSVSIPNVVARFRGSDPEMLGEAVVIGAHVDHVGVDDRGRIYRGADDNAGGVAALIEVAEAFGEHKPETKRSLIFVAFTGEEKGLLGSNAYVKTPPVPIANTYAMINMDIIARGRRSNIEATLPDERSVLNRELKQAGRISRCRLRVGDGGKQFFQRSDHYEFHKVGVPTVFFNEGETNEDYHRWTDTPDKALDEKVARVAALAYALGYLTANSDSPGGLK